MNRAIAAGPHYTLRRTSLHAAYQAKTNRVWAFLFIVYVTVLRHRVAGLCCRGGICRVVFGVRGYPLYFFVETRLMVFNKEYREFSQTPKTTLQILLRQHKLATHDGADV